MKILSKIHLITFFCSTTLLAQNGFIQNGVKENIVKIYVHYVDYSYSQPWNLAPGEAAEGSGCIIKDNLILTNAHVVGKAMYIQVKRSGQPQKYLAQVKHIAYECDLAVLTVKDKSFFAGVTPPEIGELPYIGDEAAVYGFPELNEQLTITKGIVSTLEHIDYYANYRKLLACQVDAALNAGNSGGPAISNNKIIGIAFQALDDAENIGYIIPPPVINHFLEDIKDGKYDGIPGLGVDFQYMENPDMRHYYGMSEKQTGILITNIFPSSPALNILMPQDVILSISGYKITNTGTIEFREKEWTSFGYVIQNKFLGEEITLKILRDKKLIDFTILLTQPYSKFALVTYIPLDDPPAYYIYNGFVFQPLTVNLLFEYQLSGIDYPTNYLYCYDYVQPTQKQQQVVVIANVLAHENNTGYEYYYEQIVISANGKKINTLKDLVDAIENNTGDYHILELDRGIKIIMDKKKADKSSKQILKDNWVGKGRDRSEDL
ncbi:MAG: PDZ domain-containing protein [Cytophagales bacterium]|nr:PDZ domain-containing protein [Cytophagales bacterium]